MTAPRRDPAADFAEAVAYLRAQVEAGATLPPEDVRRVLDANARCLADLATVERRAYPIMTELWRDVSMSMARPATIEPPVEMLLARPGRI